MLTALTLLVAINAMKVHSCLQELVLPRAQMELMHIAENASLVMLHAKSVKMELSTLAHHVLIISYLRELIVSMTVEMVYTRITEFAVNVLIFAVLAYRQLNAQAVCKEMFCKELPANQIATLGSIIKEVFVLNVLQAAHHAPAMLHALNAQKASYYLHKSATLDAKTDYIYLMENV